MPFYLGETRDVLFIHIPKTGGTTIEHWLRTTGKYRQLFFSDHILEDTKVTGQHFGYDTISHLLGDLNTKQLYKFTIVRNPYDRLVSEFFYRVKIKDLILGTNPEKYFSTWIDYILGKYEKDESVLDNHIRPQSYFTGRDVKYFKFEDGIENAIAQVAVEVNINNNCAIESKKVGEKKSVVWSRDALEKVHDIYSSDFKNFEYPKIEYNNEVHSSSNFDNLKHKLEFHLRRKRAHQKFYKFLNLRSKL